MLKFIKKITIIMLFFIFNLNLYCDDLVSFSITVISKNKLPVPNAIVQIGDLLEYTNSSGKAFFKTFPATYEILISKQNYITKKDTIEVNQKTLNFIFTLEENFIPVSVKIIDSLTNIPISASIKITNLNTNSSYYYPVETGEVTLELDKNSIFLLEVEEPGYTKFSRTLDTSKMNFSSFIFKLEKENADANFNINVSNGYITLKYFNSNKIYKEFEFSSQNISLPIPFGKYEITITANGYKSLTKIINIDKKNFSENFNLVSLNKIFLFYVKADAENNITFKNTLDKSKNVIPMNNTTINFFSDDILVKSIIFKDKEESLDIPPGKYTLEIKNNMIDTYLLENIIFNENTPQYVIISLKQPFSTIKGYVNFGTYLIGGVTIFFKDSFGNTYQTISDIDGSYSIKLPTRNYTVSIYKEGYTLKGNQPIEIKSYLPDETITRNIDIEEIKSMITGKILNLNGLPVSRAKITVKIDKDEYVTYSEEDGSYSLAVNSGLSFIKIEKPGYKSKGTVKTINRFLTISNLDFTLEEILTSIDGVVTDGISPLSNIEIKLLSFEKKLIMKTTSKSDGSYTFSNIKTLNDYYIQIENPSYLIYTSPLINVNLEPIKNLNIQLIKNAIKIILEIKDNNNNPISDENIIINNMPYKTDITGFVELEFNNINIKNISISIPKYNYIDTINIEPNNYTIKKSIIIKK